MTQTKSKRGGNGTLRAHLEPLEVGQLIGHANLSLVPLTGGDGDGGVEYILGADAIEAGELTVAEVSVHGTVPELLAVNHSDQNVLLLDGEELVGAKQNRILNTTVLLAANSETKIPVSCVEQGRWRTVSAKFSSGHFSSSRMRARKNRDVTRNLRAFGMAASDQGAVWEEVADSARAMKAESPTMAMHDAYEQRREKLDGYVKALQYPARARGVVVAIDGRFVALDLFDRPAILERLWPRLIGGYAVDAIVAGEQSNGSKSFTAKGAAALLEHVGEIPAHPCPSPGMGKDWRFEAEDLAGQALIVQKSCLHLSAFPNVDNAEDGSPRPRSPRIMPPSRRRSRPHGSSDEAVD